MRIIWSISSKRLKLLVIATQVCFLVSAILSLLVFESFFKNQHNGIVKAENFITVKQLDLLTELTFILTICWILIKTVSLFIFEKNSIFVKYNNMVHLLFDIVIVAANMFVLASYMFLNTYTDTFFVSNEQNPLRIVMLIPVSFFAMGDFVISTFNFKETLQSINNFEKTINISIKKNKTNNKLDENAKEIQKIKGRLGASAVSVQDETQKALSLMNDRSLFESIQGFVSKKSQSSKDNPKAQTTNNNLNSNFDLEDLIKS
jgi:hypothetical protein